MLWLNAVDLTWVELAGALTSAKGIWLGNVAVFITWVLALVEVGVGVVLRATQREVVSATTVAAKAGWGAVTQCPVLRRAPYRLMVCSHRLEILHNLVIS